MLGKITANQQSFFAKRNGILHSFKYALSLFSQYTTKYISLLAKI